MCAYTSKVQELCLNKMCVYRDTSMRCGGKKCESSKIEREYSDALARTIGDRRLIGCAARETQKKCV